ncbi:MAG: hypothetical protein ACRC7D_01725 [Aeromonas popoffii]|uniref:hypothetical protein n=1 Tax=Aeromonas popoffii TaxID=70856 RepID=UPI003F416997
MEQYRVPFRQNNPTLIMGVEAPRLVGSIILWVGMSILGFNLIGIGFGLAYWVMYKKMQGDGGLKGGIIHTLWRLGLWVDGKKHKYNPQNPDLYS